MSSEHTHVMKRVRDPHRRRDLVAAIFLAACVALVLAFSAYWIGRLIQ